VLKEDHALPGLLTAVATAQVASIDRDGNVISANDAWRLTVSRSGSLISGAQPGENFLHALQDAQEDIPAAHTVLGLCRAVLAAESEGFSTVYEGADAKKYEIRGVRVPGSEKVRLVVWHQATAAVQESQARPTTHSFTHNGGEAGHGAIPAHDRRPDFLSAISHELRSPLTAIVTFSEILAHDRERTLTGRQLDHVRIIQQNAHRMHRLVSDLLDLTRFEAGTFSLKASKFDAVALVQEVAQGLQPVLAGRRQRLTLLDHRPHVFVEADRDRVAQVLSNLIDNASKYSPHETEIRVTVRSGEGWLRLEVADEGPGIPQAALARVFDAFYRVDSPATRAVPGTGLGLPIVKKLIEMHGGKVEIASEHGAGTTVSVSLPGALG
jgi:signal transduction histidine kinase